MAAAEGSAASASLEANVGGPATPLFEDKLSGRRTVYGFIDRQNLDSIYRTFDFASPNATSPQRFITTVPQQALFMMNSPFVQRCASELADAVRGQEPEAAVRALHRSIFARDPDADELELGVAFVSAARY